MFELVDKEEAHGLIAGSLYGAAVRVIARSPTHVLFSALGIQLWNRSEHGGWHNLQTLTRKRPSRAAYDAIRPRIDEVFGEGATDRIIENNRKSKTLLVEGGGTAMPLPRVQHAAKVQVAHREVSPDWRADLTGRVLCCKQCGEQLRPSTDHHRLGYKLIPNHPQSREDCQRLTNQEVIAVHGFDTRYEDRWAYVEWFETWDGQSYFDVDFCNDKCAANYGRRAARDRDLLEPGGEVPRTEYRPREDTNHAEPEEPMYAEGPNGQRIRLR